MGSCILNSMVRFGTQISARLAPGEVERWVVDMRSEAAVRVATSADTAPYTIQVLSAPSHPDSIEEFDISNYDNALPPGGVEVTDTAEHVTATDGVRKSAVVEVENTGTEGLAIEGGIFVLDHDAELTPDAFASLGFGRQSKAWFDGRRVMDIDHTRFHPRAQPPRQEGLVYYDEQANALSYTNDSEEVTVNIGQEMLFEGRNETGGGVTDGTPVYISGSTGSNTAFELASANGIGATGNVGLTTEDIGNNQRGYVTVFGFVRGLDTTSYNEGDVLFLNGNPGELTVGAPDYPQRDVRIGVVVSSHPQRGIISVAPDEVNPAVTSSEGQLSDPANPPNGEFHIWESDGSTVGSDGDLYVDITDSNGTTKRAQLVDFSSL